MLKYRGYLLSLWSQKVSAVGSSVNVSRGNGKLWGREESCYLSGCVQPSVETSEASFIHIYSHLFTDLHNLLLNFIISCGLLLVEHEKLFFKGWIEIKKIALKWQTRENCNLRAGSKHLSCVFFVSRVGSVPVRCSSWTSTALDTASEAATVTWATWRIWWIIQRTTCWSTPRCCTTATPSAPRTSTETGTALQTSRVPGLP